MQSLNSRYLGLAKLALGAIALSLSISSCNWFRSDNQTGDEVGPTISVQELSNNQKLLENESRGVRLTIPEDWETIGHLRPDADIYTANERENMYVLVLADNRNETVEQFTLADHASLYRRVLAGQLDRNEGQVPTQITSVNGQAAEQYEIRGQIDGTPIVYIHTTISGAENYYQVIGWTHADQYDERIDELRNVIESFRGA